MKEVVTREDLEELQRRYKETGLKALSWTPKPVIIDYPEDRETLKREFKKITEQPGFARSVTLALEVLYGSKSLTKNGVWKDVAKR